MRGSGPGPGAGWGGFIVQTEGSSKSMTLSLPCPSVCLWPKHVATSYKRLSLAIETSTNPEDSLCREEHGCYGAHDPDWRWPSDSWDHACVLRKPATAKLKATKRGINTARRQIGNRQNRQNEQCDEAWPPHLSPGFPGRVHVRLP